ncbi:MULTISPECIES: flagellar basal body rod protein FlgC [unclassified Modestobacter]|uniref:flagellar basal body rod protein FlgC n=1 Tax=unclassified Modestobacter TaxID=2643866 RepID=UPI0022AB3702|nr:MULTISPECIES: flagellar basal body rod C-terminal domain-containing protein [unclassified Modestobacter]MCZ2825104.1 flagellar basal-body rod protein FlgC [Modestobacter sp. VKM Ac-2981]MCZ2853831.1 flagellar basal-body rod protein FlgC [Modestobacter sp. VKM Ac-2982]
MAVFDTLRIGGSSLFVHRKWMDAVADNMANINTVNAPGEDAFQERMIVAEAVQYGSGQGGVRVAGTELGSAEGRMVYEPSNPLADDEGYVRYPDIDLGDQMTQLLMAQRGYQANLATIRSATEAYQQALQLGKG